MDYVIFQSSVKVVFFFFHFLVLAEPLVLEKVANWNAALMYITQICLKPSCFICRAQ